MLDARDEIHNGNGNGNGDGDHGLPRLRGRLSSEAVRSLHGRDGVVERGGTRRFVRGLPDEEDEILLVEEEATPGSGVPADTPAFPPAAAREVRERAWARYAETLGRPDGSPLAVARRRPSAFQPWIEAGACLGLLILANLLLFPTHLGFRGLEFNPYFAPVLLVAVRYGTLMGFWTGLATAVWLVIAEGRFDLEGGPLILPGLLVAVGTLAGVLSRRQGDRLSFYRAKASDLEAERERYRKALRARNAVIRDLQGRIEEHAEPIETLYGMSRRMGSGDLEAMVPCLIDLLAHDMKVERAAVYLFEEGRLTLRASRDLRSVAAPFPPVLDQEAGLIGMALRERRVVSVFDAEASKLGVGEAGPALLCGPLHEGEELKGLLVVEQMPLLEFSSALVARFSGLVRWADESLARATRLRAAQQRCTVDEEVGTYSTGHLVETLAREIGRAERYDAPVRLLMVRIAGFDGLPDAYRRVARQNVACVLCANTRAIDTVCSLERPDTFAVILPMYRGEDPALMSNRITGTLGSMWWPFPVELQYASADLAGRSMLPGDLIVEAEERFKAVAEAPAEEVAVSAPVNGRGEATAP